MKVLHLLGYASGTGGKDPGSEEGPRTILQSKLVAHLPLNWDAMLTAPTTPMRPDQKIRDICLQLAKHASELVKQKTFFCAVGGDHTCAIGTWSGVYDAMHQQGDIGLIWIDAHMDSHTPETTESGNLHGMPVASLLGYGYDTLSSILNNAPKLKPENLCMIGIRSFEKGEAELLKKLNVKIYNMKEVLQRGFNVVLQEAIAHVSKHTIGYGLSFDLDALDPTEAPGVDSPVQNGIKTSDFFAGIKQIANDPRLIATEIVEFNPSRDSEALTEKVIADFFKMLIAERKE